MSERMIQDIRDNGFVDIYLKMPTYVGAILTGLIRGEIYEFVVIDIIDKDGVQYTRISEPSKDFVI